MNAITAALAEVRERITLLEQERTQLGEAVLVLERLNGNKLLPAVSSAKPSKDKKEAARRLYESDPSLSVTDIADRVGVSDATIYAWRKAHAWIRAGD
jgi:hypothetical protein